MIRKNLLPRKIADCIMRGFSGFSVLFAVSVMLWILATVAIRGGRALNWDFFLHVSAPYGTPESGIANAVCGTLLITLCSALIAVPSALLAGIFLAEYKEYRRIVASLRFAANITMGMPSVLVGLFVYMILVQPSGHFSGFAGAVALAILMFPVVMRTTEDMLLMVPDSLRESALALGMTKTRTTLAIVCRSARNGLLTGVLLALARVSGETAPLLFTAMFADAWPDGFFTGPTANLPVLITEYATNSPFETMHSMGWGAALVVCALVLAVNIGTRIIFREKKHDN